MVWYIFKDMDVFFDPVEDALMSGGNPSSIHRLGQKALALYDAAVRSIQHSLHASSVECVLAGSAHEAHALALKNHLETASPPRAHVLVCGHAELPPAYLLLAGITSNVFVHVDTHTLLSHLSSHTACVWFAPNHGADAAFVAAVSHASRSYGCPVHVHGPVAGGFDASGAQSMVVDSFEQGGPPGVAALLQHKGMPLQPLWYGGGQQKGFRPGTLPVALAVGMAAALRIKNP